MIMTRIGSSLTVGIVPKFVRVGSAKKDRFEIISLQDKIGT